jgi:spore coat polysaccharide biosynthesis predicted glycosyltransferase SpsG
MMIKILTEAGKDIGWGHVSRCSALFEEIIVRDIEARMYVAGEFTQHNMLEEIDYQSVDWKNISFLEKELKSDDLVIIDSYQADYEILKFISDFVKKVLFIDDYNRLQYPKGIVLNPSLNVKALHYPRNNHMKYLFGKDYIILRRPFTIQTNRKLNNLVKRVLITLGGEDRRGLTQIILDKLINLYPNMTFDVVHLDIDNLKVLFKNYKNIN